MRVYFSGISGTGIGPLAEIAHGAGFDVVGSDLQRGAISGELEARGIEVFYGEQDGSFLRKCHEAQKIDWLVYTSALPKNHAELLAAAELGIHCSKRDEFLAKLIDEKNLKMIAVAGTHGKTTTTAMLVWAFRELGAPLSYLVGTTLPWADGGRFNESSEYFVYEADEYDRNFLAYHPHIAVITCVDYDHPDIYPTKADYDAAFAQFESQSENVVKNTTIDERINLVGELRRQDASAALAALRVIFPERDENEIIAVLNRFPGAGRRFEKITDGVYSDYGHHPEEIRTTLEMAKELKDKDGFEGVAAIYQPHQNTRQHEVFKLYHDAFAGADRIFWLPTYLTRENPELVIIQPNEFIATLDNAAVAESAELNDELAAKIRELHENGWLIILLTAGPADAWLRNIFNK